VIDLRDANPVPRDRIEGWSLTPEGLAARGRAELGGPAGPLPHRRQWVSVSVAAAVVLALVASVLAVQRATRSSPSASRSTIARLADGKWTQIGTTALQGVSSVWTGRELFLWGAPIPAGSSGMTLDPRNGKSRVVGGGPSQRQDALLLWTGREVLIWGGSCTVDLSLVGCSTADGATYDPATRAWAPVPAAPFPWSPGVTATWTGHEMVVTNPTGSGPSAATYDPATEAWTALPDPPMSFSQSTVAAAWNGQQVVFGLLGGPIPDGRAAEAFDPAQRAWRGLPVPPANGQSNTMDLVPGRKSVVQVAWVTDVGSRGYLREARLGLGASLWILGSTTFGHRGICPAQATRVSGGAVLFCGGNDYVALDIRSGSWEQLPRLSGGVALGPLTWTEHELVGVAPDGRIFALAPAAR
jgi:hypothetical protein